MASDGRRSAAPGPRIDVVEHAPRLVVGSGREATVVLAEPSLPFPGDVLVDLSVEVDAPGLQLRRWVRTIAGDGLAEFLAGLDADFRGWDGKRHWRSLEGDLSIEATHAGQSVILATTLLRDRKADAWSLTIPLMVSPGEELHALAADAGAFFRAALEQESPHGL